jgi:peptide/nickel transport system substrate-binding protein
MDNWQPDLFHRQITRRTMLGGLVVAGVGFAAACTPGTTTKSGTGIITTDVGLEPPTMNPLFANYQYLAWIYRQVTETLYWYDPASLKAIPFLAAAMPTTIDDLHQEIKIKPGIFFHNGDELTAQHVAATITYAAAPGHGVWNSHLLAVKSVDVVDNYTIRFTFSQPWGLLVEKLQAIPIIHKDWTTKTDSMMGTGPFVWGQHTPGVSVSLKPNPKYRGGAPSASGAVFRFVPESGARLVNIIRGDSTIDPGVGYQDVPLLQKNSAIQVGQAFAPLAITMRPNCAFGPFRDVRVRQALGFAMNRAKIRDVVFGGLAEIGQGPIAPGLEGYDPSLAVYKPEPDFEQAKSLLRAAGFPDGSTIPFDWVSTFDDTLRNLGAVLKADWATVGFACSLNYLELAEWGARTKLGGNFGVKLGFDMNGAGIGPYPQTVVLLKGNPINSTQFNDDESTAIALQAATLQAGPQRASLYAKWSQIVAQKGAWLAPAYPKFNIAYLRTLQGLPEWQFKMDAIDLTHASVT